MTEHFHLDPVSTTVDKVFTRHYGIVRMEFTTDPLAQRIFVNAYRERSLTVLPFLSFYVESSTPWHADMWNDAEMRWKTILGNSRPPDKVEWSDTAYRAYLNGIQWLWGEFRDKWKKK